uniref:Uncharacterized protein n=1 Tax=Picea sitchensis TaxID=3332 RepID=A9NL69_PICSI|nr:unknown [Picea sitchensis]
MKDTNLFMELRWLPASCSEDAGAFGGASMFIPVMVIVIVEGKF